MRFVCVEKRTVSVNRFLSNNDEFLFFLKLSAVSLFCHHIFSESFLFFIHRGTNLCSNKHMQGNQIERQQSSWVYK